MVAYRFGSAVVVVLTVSALSSFPTYSPPTALAAPPQSINAQVYAPHQAIVFDGSVLAEKTYLVALSDAGFLERYLAAPLDCGQIIQTPEWAVKALGVPGRGIFNPGLFNFDAVVFPRPAGPRASPFDPAALATDCDVLAVFTEVQQYLAEVRAEAEQLQAQVDQCLTKVRTLHCLITDTIDNAPTIPISPGDANAPLIDALVRDSWSLNTLPESKCVDCAGRLTTLPQRLDALESEAGRCRAEIGSLSDTLNALTVAIATDGGLSSTQKELNQQAADRGVAHAEAASVRAAEDVAALDEVDLACALDRVTANCAACSPATDKRGRSVGVLVEWNRQPIGRLVGAFLAAAGTADSPEMVDRLGDLAARLTGLPGNRVLHVTFKTASLISQELVALAPPPTNTVDTSQAPLAIVLTLLNRDAPLPAMTAGDQRVAFDAMRAFYDLVVTPRK